MEEMMEQALSHVKYYICFSYDHGDVVGNSCINLTDVERMNINFFKNIIQNSYDNNIYYEVEIVLEYPTTRSSKPYLVRLLRKPLFDYNVDYEQVKDKTIGECVLNVLNDLNTDRYNEFTIESINRLKDYLNANIHQLNK